MNAFFRLIERRNWAFKTTLPNLFCYDSFVWEMYRKHRRSAFGGSCLINPFKMDLLLCPRHTKIDDEDHWVLVAVWPQLKHIRTFDSLGLDHPILRQEMLGFLSQEAQRRDLPFEKRNWTLLPTPSGCPKQEERECGVMVCLMAEVLARRSDLSEIVTAAVSNRRDVMSRLRHGRIAQEDFQAYEASPSSFLCPEDRERVNGFFPCAWEAEERCPITSETQDFEFVSVEDPLIKEIDQFVNEDSLVDPLAIPVDNADEDEVSSQSDALIMEIEEREMDFLNDPPVKEEPPQASNEENPVHETCAHDDNPAQEQVSDQDSEPDEVPQATSSSSEPRRRKKNRKSKRRRVFLKDKYGRMTLQRINVKFLPPWF